jgi:hypothetical protein
LVISGNVLDYQPGARLFSYENFVISLNISDKSTSCLLFHLTALSMAGLFTVEWHSEGRTEEQEIVP